MLIKRSTVTLKPKLIKEADLKAKKEVNKEEIKEEDSKEKADES